MTHVVLSLGSNIDRDKNIRYALDSLSRQYDKLDISPVYETSSVGFEGPSFYNLAVGIRTNEALQTVVDWLHKVETDAGRVRGPKAFASRVLDIDVVLYGKKNFRDQGINVPRDEIEKYAYVLKPLADLYPDLVHPLLGITIEEMWQQFEIKDQVLFMAQRSLTEMTADG